MRVMPFACLGAIELGNVARVTSYGVCEFFDGSCPCPALDEETYVSPSADPSPWYDATHPESEDFFGFLPESITLSPPGSRTTVASGTTGSFVGPERLPGRVIDVVGWMVARDYQSMWYGEQWLTEALRGNRCEGCANDVLTLLPFCRESDDSIPDYSGDFRTLVGTALVAGPRWVEVSDDPSYMVVTGQFQLTSKMPYLYHPPERCIDAEPLGTVLSCALTTPDWPEDGTFRIEIENTDAAPATDIVITGRLSLDGDCPTDLPGSSVPPSFVYTIPTLAPEDRIVIDGTRRQALLYDASAKTASSALSSIEWEGRFPWADVGPCSTMCLTIEGSGYADVTVDSYLRSL